MDLADRDVTRTPPGSAVGFACLAIFLLLTFSRLTDLLLADLYLPLAFALIALVTLVASGDLPGALRNRPGIYLIAFTGWLFLATPFSYWREGSLELLWSWTKSFIVFVLMAGLIRTGRHCRLVAGTFAISTVVVILQALLLGERSVDGRLTVGQGVLGNPNDLAQLVLNGAPFLFLPLLGRGAPILRFVGLGAAAASVAVIAAAGSRGSLFAVAAMGFVVALRQPMVRRLQIAIAGIVVLLLVLASLPADLARRYATFFSADQGEQMDETAVSSSQQRMVLLRESIDLTLRHPLVGVGPGTFAAASADEAGVRGESAKWRETHNAYTQVSSEAGVPALVFFLSTIIVSLRSQVRVLKDLKGRSEAAPLRNVAYCLLASFVGYIVVCVFSSIAYAIYLPTFAGFTVALSRAAMPEGERMQGVRGASRAMEVRN